MNKIRTIAVLPTLFTLGNLFCGFFAIVVAARVDPPTSVDVPRAREIDFRSPAAVMRELDPLDDAHNVMLSGWLIFLAMVFDALDGHLARLSRTTSDFGAQLDSLCDVVTFGVAPGILLVKMCPQFTYLHRDWVWIIAASFTACAALRLARFNAENDQDEDHMYFTGLPSPAAAASVAGFAILFYTLRKETNTLAYAADVDWVLQRLLPLFALLVAALMVSRIPYPHVVNQIFRGHRSMGHIVGLLFSLVAVMVIRGYSIPIIACIFVLGPPIRFLWQRWMHRGAESEPIF